MHVNKQKKHVALSLSVLGAVGGAVTTTIPSVHADVYGEAVERATTMGGLNKTTDKLSASDEAKVNDINSALSNLTSSGLVRVNGELTVQSNQLDDFKKKADELQKLIDEANQLSKTIANQQANYSQLTGQADLSSRDDLINIEASNYDTVVADLQRAVNELKSTIASNEKSLQSIARSNAASVVAKQVTEQVKRNNKTITNASSNVDYYADGITGNLDQVHRKADDSNKLNTQEGKVGVVVDTSKTKQTNTVNISSNSNVTTTPVTTVAEADRELSKILGEIANANRANQNQVLNSDTYKDNALQNIDSINEWLAKESKRSEQIQEAINQNMGAATKMSAYKTSYLAKLNELKTYVTTQAKGSAQSKQKIIAQIDEAIAKINQSDVRQNLTDTIEGSSNVDFGDIGRPNSEVKKKQDDISRDTDGRVATALEKMKSSNATAEAAIQEPLAKNQKAIDDFITKLHKGGSGSQISEEWLNERKIYSQGTSTYRNYIKNALSQTEEDASTVFTRKKEYGNVTIKSVPNGTSAAKASAGEYLAQSEHGFDNGFGSPMVPSKNVNDFAQVLGNKWANSKRSSVTSILNKINSHYGNYIDTFKNSAVYNDIMNQHVNAVGEENVFMVASYSPHAEFILKDTFVYVDADGNHRTADMKLDLRLTDVDGNNPTANMRKHNSTTRGIYFFYMSVDPNTGQLVVGGGFIPIGSIEGGSAGNGGGEMGVEDLPQSGSSDPTDIDAEFASIYDGHAGVSDTTLSYANGLVMNFGVSTQNAAGEWAKNAPLYVSDIDDGQALYVRSDRKLDVIMGESNGVTAETRGNITKITSSDLGKSNGSNGTTNLDSQSVMIFGKDSQPGLIKEYGGIGHEGNYQSIDVTLFAPFGVIGAPKLKVNQVNSKVDTFTISKPSAHAHTEGKYEITNPRRYLTTRTNPTPERVHNKKVQLTIPKLTHSQTTKRVADQTSFVVRSLADEVRKTASGNSMIVRTLNNDARTASSNSLVVRTKSNDNRTSSGNSLVIRQIVQDHRTASGNSLVTRVLSSVVTSNENSDVKPEWNGKTLKFTAYVDEKLRPYAEKALNDWKKALKPKGVNLDISFTSSLDDLKNGTALSILDADNETTRLDLAEGSVGYEDDRDYEMKGFGGLAMTRSHLNLVDADPNDKYNRSGSIRKGDILKNTKYIVQMNTDALTTEKDIVGVMKHELGHIFGLGHKDDDTLMTTFKTNPSFTGEISEWASSTAARQILKGKAFTL